MHLFQCGHEECASEYIAANKDDLMAQVSQHLKDAHDVNNATQTLMGYLESTCVTVKP